ncbi:MAG: putative GntR family transcriptional regulator, partial [Nocardia sp.]|uniref:GntR family transcriptional regulator n=1 Tax=Nocardia sp. TaxID=1821 RepID=UPI00261F40AD
MPRADSSYQLVARELKVQILQGAFDGGRQLPTEVELANDYSVSRQTIRRAFQDLVAEGMVYRVPGRGTFTQTAHSGYVRQVGSIDDLMGLSEDTRMA